MKRAARTALAVFATGLALVVVGAGLAALSPVLLLWLLMGGKITPPALPTNK